MTLMYKIPKNERPRERLKSKGPDALGDYELLALILGTGNGNENVVESSQRIIREIGGIEQLAKKGQGLLEKLPGVGAAKAARIIAALELGIRIVERRFENTHTTRFGCSLDIYETYKARLSLLSQEVFLVVGLNNKNEVLKEVVVAKGTVNECQVGPREVFHPMIAEAAARMIALHNHPSGDPTPSVQDIAMTHRLVDVGKLVGIPLLDHIIVGSKGYSSLRDLGIITT